MLGRLALSGCTSWMNWLRSPRLNRAVHSVAALTPMSMDLVSGFRAMVSVGGEVVVDDDARVALAVGGDQAGEIRRRAAVRDGALREQLLLDVGHREHLLQVFRDLLDDLLGRAVGREQADPRP